MISEKLKFSILIPVYKGSQYLQEALESVYRQNFPFFEVIICDDNHSSDKHEIQNTRKIVSKFKDKKAEYFKNKTNLNSQGTIKKLASLAQGDVLFYLCQDDVLIGDDVLKKTHDAFFLSDDVGVVTRPFYWFEDDMRKPIREVKPFNKVRDTVLSLFDDKKAVQAVFGSVGQISGLAYRKKYITTPFHSDIFPGHIYPIAGILKYHSCVFLKDYTVAVRLKSSQSRHISSIYNKSPLESWVQMFKTVYGVKSTKARIPFLNDLRGAQERARSRSEKNYIELLKRYSLDQIRQQGIKHIATHYEGLVQIKNFAPEGALFREIRTHLKVFWPSLFDPKFWFFVIITVLLPKKILLFLSDSYKRYALSLFISSPFPLPVHRSESQKQ